MAFFFEHRYHNEIAQKPKLLGERLRDEAPMAINDLLNGRRNSVLDPEVTLHLQFGLGIVATDMKTGLRAVICYCQRCSSVPEMLNYSCKRHKSSFNEWRITCKMSNSENDFCNAGNEGLASNRTSTVSSEEDWMNEKESHTNLRAGPEAIPLIVDITSSPIPGFSGWNRCPKTRSKRSIEPTAIPDPSSNAKRVKPSQQLGSPHSSMSSVGYTQQQSPGGIIDLDSQQVAMETSQCVDQSAIKARLLEQFPSNDIDDMIMY